MAVSPSATFPPRKRRPAATSFLAPNLNDHDLLHALHSLSLSISALRPLPLILRRASTSIIRKCRLLSFLCETLLRRPIHEPLPAAPSRRHLYFEEMYIVLLRIKTLIEDCAVGSQTWLLMKIETIALNFRGLTSDMLTLLEILDDHLRLSEDLEELKVLLMNQCSESRSSAVAAVVDPADESLRTEVVGLLDSIEREIVPEHGKLRELFGKLGLTGSASCSEEIERLEDEIQFAGDEYRPKLDAVALVGLVRYAKCVLFGGSTPDYGDRRRNTALELGIPADFRCPISLDLMRDPVVVATGQTYDRPSIVSWIESGHSTCPKTGQTLASTSLIPNLALKGLIGLWCREQRMIPYEAKPGAHGLIMVSKAALAATKMTASFLVDSLGSSRPVEAAAQVNWVVYELRTQAKVDSECRACIGEAGAIPALAQHLGSDEPSIQVNAMTTLFNLSIHDANKTRIMDSECALNGIIEVLQRGASWEAKGNAAATILSLCGIHVYRKNLGKNNGVLRGLLRLAKEGTIGSKKDALVAIWTLGRDRETATRLVEGGVMDMVNDVLEEMPEEALNVLEVVVKRGGCVAVAAAACLIPKLAKTLKDGTSKARETSAAALLTICRKGGDGMVAELARELRAEEIMRELIQAGTPRAKRKAASLVRIFHRWAADIPRQWNQHEHMHR